MSEQRIKGTDKTIDAVAKMSEGNFGAMDALMGLLKSDHIDPDNMMGGLGVVLFLDTLGIYGTDIYVLYSDICSKDLPKMMAVLRAVQLGLFPRVILKDACSRQDYSGRQLVPVDDLYLKVKEKLPRFNS